MEATGRELVFFIWRSIRFRKTIEIEFIFFQIYQSKIYPSLCDVFSIVSTLLFNSLFLLLDWYYCQSWSCQPLLRGTLVWGQRQSWCTHPGIWKWHTWCVKLWWKVKSEWPFLLNSWDNNLVSARVVSHVLCFCSFNVQMIEIGCLMKIDLIDFILRFFIP